MSSRILDPEQIATLDPTAIPRLRMPERLDVFAPRAARLRQLAETSPIGDYLRLMAALTEAQQEAIKSIEAELPSPDAVALAQQHSMPILPASGKRDPVWREVFARLLDALRAGELPAPLRALVERAGALDAQALEQHADAVLAAQSGGSSHGVDAALAPFVMAALQVVWTDMASRTDAGAVPYLDTPGACPCCGALPVASVIRIGGQYQGYRYLQCGLCATEWHVVRVTCTHCGSNKGIAYHGIEGGSEAVKAESCDECGTYRKIVSLEKDRYGEPMADDLASLPLDLLMAETGYRRSSGHPLLWQPEAEEDPAAPAEAPGA